MAVNKNRILILDDDPDITQTLKLMLERLDCEVRCSIEHVSFFEILDQWQPDYIFTDLIMPNMDGVQVFEYLAEKGVQTKLVISSGADARVLNAAKLSAIEHGLSFAGVLKKPFKRDDLRRLLHETSATSKSSSRSSANYLPPELPVRDLELALERGEIYIVLQPKILCANQKLAGFEVLARWNHPERGGVNPETFIGLAESNGLIDTLTEQVVTQALDWLAKLPEQIKVGTELSGLSTELSNMLLSINISARSLSNKDLFTNIANHCELLNINTSQIILELTETSAMENPLSSLDILTRLRMQGFMLSIDDFGTGYSSMKQLVRLPFSEIKVDKSFVISALSDAESMAIVRSIIELGHSLGLSVTAEGVENIETLAALGKMGCELGQGYFIAKPLSLDKVDEWIIEHVRKCEQLRLADLAKLELLDTDSEERFDRHTQFAQQYFKVPYALVSLVARNRQWFKSNVGYPAQGSERSESFCTHAVTSIGRDVFEVQDATLHPVFAQYRSVIGKPGIRYYAGVPLRGPQGHHIGTFCIIDTVPRKLDVEQLEKLRSLAKMVEFEIGITGSATRDTTAGTLSRQGLEARAQEMLKYAYKLSLSVIELTVRIENLQEINQKFGYQPGNNAIAAVAKVLGRVVRRSDIIGRYTGSSFKAFLLDVPEERVESVNARFIECLDEVNSRSDTFQIKCKCTFSPALKVDKFAHDLL